MSSAGIADCPGVCECLLSEAGVRAGPYSGWNRAIVLPSGSLNQADFPMPGVVAIESTVLNEEAALAASSSCRATADQRPNDLLDRDLEASDDAGVAASRE